MINLARLMAIEKEQIPEAAKNLELPELPYLVELLSEKDDKIRYQAFLLLQSRSRSFDDVCPFWETFRAKLKDENSYQRSLGVMLIAENARWASKDRIEDAMDDVLSLLRDEKPITVRQCIQSLGEIAEAQPDFSEKIAKELMTVDLDSIKETMRKSILLDIMNVLLAVRKYTADETEGYILHALTGDILDKKTKKQLSAML